MREAERQWVHMRERTLLVCDDCRTVLSVRRVPLDAQRPSGFRGYGPLWRDRYRVREG